MTGDIGNAYLNTNTEEKIYTCSGAKFEFVGIMDEGPLLEVVKTLYGLLTSGNRWHAHLSHTLRAMSFKTTFFKPDFWIRGHEWGCDYIGIHTNDVLVVSVNPISIFNKLKDTYTIDDFVPKKVHLGCDYSQVKKGATNRWVMGSSTYTSEYLRNFCALLKISTLRKFKLPNSPCDHPELDLSPLIGEEQHRL